jgi:hypothetical protein
LTERCSPIRAAPASLFADSTGFHSSKNRSAVKYYKNSIMAVAIEPWISELNRLGAKEVDQYERKLRSFGDNEQKIFEFLSEARAALLFLRSGWCVTMRDSPDLVLKFSGENIYAEIKHMNEKETDRREKAAMAEVAPLEFVQVGNVIDDEGEHGWQGMCRIAIRKVSQYLDGEQNILIFVSYSESLDLFLQSAVNEFDDLVEKAGAASPLRKLGGMMMFSSIIGPVSGMSNVAFCPTRYPLKPISCKLASAMSYGQIA